jgi:hypothetical protein
VISSTRNPVYAKQKLSPLHPRDCFFHFLLVGFLIICRPAASQAESHEDAVRILAHKVASSIRGASVTCFARNLSSLSGEEFSILSATFREELQRRGVRILTGDAAMSVVLTVTENPTVYMGIVQIRSKENTETVMESLGPVEGAPAAELAYSLVLHRDFLFSQDSPILDVVLEKDGKHADALGPQGITFYELQGEHWKMTGVEHLPAHRSSSRELRGFLFFDVDTEAVYFPAELCRLSIFDGKGWSCEKYMEPMPVRSVSEDATAGKKLGSWFSAAQFGPEQATRIIVTGQEGSARLYEEGPDPVALFPGWGSEIASVHTGCGGGWQLLVTGQRDWTQADTIQAVEIRERRAQPVTSPVEVAGAVIALHTPATRSADEASASASAVAVVRNLRTGRYEVYRLSITCPN